MFQHVVFYDNLDIPSVINTRPKFQGWPALWIKRIVATLHSPFATTLVADTDVHACAGFSRLFDFVDDYHKMAMTVAPAPFASSKGIRQSFRADFPIEFARFPERNLGLQVVHVSH